jgi:hypothetical protein
MYRLIIALLLSVLSLSATALDIENACNERDEQKHSLLSKMSTSISEALLAGQCTGYKSINNILSSGELSKACSEFVEQKSALLPFNMSTTLSEAMLAGICVGAIYKLVEGCNSGEKKINYLYIAKDIIGTTKSQTIFRITDYLSCR